MEEQFSTMLNQTVCHDQANIRVTKWLICINDYPVPVYMGAGKCCVNGENFSESCSGIHGSRESRYVLNRNLFKRYLKSSGEYLFGIQFWSGIRVYHDINHGETISRDTDTRISPSSQHSNNEFGPDDQDENQAHYWVPDKGQIYPPNSVNENYGIKNCWCICLHTVIAVIKSMGL